MNVTGIIAEYNPFHNGHAYHLAETRRITGADFLIVVLGGNFMQRGEPAIVDKFSRTRMALLNGADLVLELPSSFATGSAEYFAKGAVGLLHKLGVVNALSFGSEAGNLSLMKAAAQLLLNEPPRYQETLKSGLKEGLSFPTAREQAIRKSLELPLSPDNGFFSAPNNILGIEYLKALLFFQSPICPVTIPRKGLYHGTLPQNTDSGEASLGYASASAIRSILRTQEKAAALEQLSLHLPQNVREILAKEEHFASLDTFSSVLHYRLLTASSPTEFAAYLDVSEDLSRRIFALRFQFSGYEHFIDLVKTRQYTRARIARALLHILLDIPAGQIELPAAVRILGFRKNTAPLLGELKKKSALPLITRLSQREDFAKEIHRSTLYHIGRPYQELSQPVVILP